MANVTPLEQEAVPAAVSSAVVAIMRAITVARLYTVSHALFQETTRKLHSALREAIAAQDFLFLGLAKEALFLNGVFYRPKEAHLQKFLRLFYLLGISYLLFDREISQEEVGSFLSLIAGSRPGQGTEISSALPREKIVRLSVGLLDYSVFSTATNVAARLARSSEDEVIWRQLILQPACAKALNLGPQQVRELLRLCDDVEALKAVIVELDAQIASGEQGAKARDLLGNFIQNLASSIEKVVPEKREQFARQVAALIDRVEPRLRRHILAVMLPDARKEEGGAIQEIFRAMSDTQVAQFHVDILREEGPESSSFLNLLRWTLDRGREPRLLLATIQKEMLRATLQGSPDDLKHWQHLEQLIIQYHEVRELDEAYRKEVASLTTSIQMNVPMVEEEEMERLLATVNADSIQTARGYLIIELVAQRNREQGEATVLSLIRAFGEILASLHREKDFRGIGELLRQLFLALARHPHEAPARETVEAALTADEIRELLDRLLEDCRSYESRESAAIAAICQLFPEKAGTYLLDVFADLDRDDNPKARWLMTTLGSVGAHLTRPLNRKLQIAPDSALPRLLALVPLCKDQRLSHVLGKLMDHRDHDMRLQVVEMMGRLKAERSVPRLAEAVLKRSWLASKKEKEVQVAAVHALAEIGSDEAKKVLTQVAREGPSDMQTLAKELLQPPRK
ncbi:MAG TPA: HEAT repeat domain-containing protein [Syntrophobacteria bacterium]|nr:HEAT repeat domain-containing protein [Syntrophobacteria bacterium]